MTSVTASVRVSAMTTLASTVVNSTRSPYTMPSWIRSSPMSMRREGSSSETASFCWKRVAHGSSPMRNTWFGCARCGLVVGTSR